MGCAGEGAPAQLDAVVEERNVDLRRGHRGGDLRGGQAFVAVQIIGRDDQEVGLALQQVLNGVGGDIADIDYLCIDRGFGAVIDAVAGQVGFRIGIPADQQSACKTGAGKH